MSDHPFRVGDKVTLIGGVGGPMTVPRLVLGRVYCVAETFTREANNLFRAHQAIRLVGVRFDKRLRNRDGGLAHCYFRRVGAANGAEKGGA